MQGVIAEVGPVPERGRAAAMRGRAGPLVAGLLSGVGLLCGPASAAQAADDAEGAARTVVCESTDMGWNHCRADVGGRVSLLRKLSDGSSTCIRGTDWGTDATGIWVARGCRAEFGIGDGGTGASIPLARCESDNGLTVSCAVRLRDTPVRLYRQLSSFPCRQGKTWGTRRNEIWVSRGCRADFELGRDDGSGFASLPLRTTCESNKGRRNRCYLGVVDGVTLERQLSRSQCVLDKSWGWDRDGIWVDEGCRAEFVVR